MKQELFGDDISSISIGSPILSHFRHNFGSGDIGVNRHSEPVIMIRFGRMVCFLLCNLRTQKLIVDDNIYRNLIQAIFVKRIMIPDGTWWYWDHFVHLHFRHSQKLIFLKPVWSAKPTANVIRFICDDIVTLHNWSFLKEFTLNRHAEYELCIGLNRRVQISIARFYTR